MKKIPLFFLSALILIAAGCKLDPPIYADLTDTTNATGTVTTPNNSASGYQPTTKGSNWKYTTTVDATTLTQATSMTGATLKINNKLYYTATTTLNTDKGYTYYYHDNDIYSYRSDMISPDLVIEYIYLKDNWDIGKTWTAPITDNGLLNGFPAQIIGKILEKDITKAVGGKTYSNVIHTHLELQYNTTGSFVTYQDIDYYIAKGVGIVYIVTKNSTNSTGTNTTTLTDYTIK
ncbi:hypothetical protein [Mucilaginibacter sp. UYCu711]|uniref:hypothetical protein n=1 Tax=Mucilaginibacter sp. UYCu711 TaxID=3156339 RepID=UPI003D226C36